MNDRDVTPKFIYLTNNYRAPQTIIRETRMMQSLSIILLLRFNSIYQIAISFRKNKSKRSKHR